MGPEVGDEIPSVLLKLKKWADYDAFGTVVLPTRFIPCKTPLATDMIDNWTLEEPPYDPLTVDILIESNLKEGKKIGMILDLSNHPTLYSEDLRKHDVEYKQVQLVAKVFPSEEAINEVKKIATDFWARHPDQYIAIHCAFGFNRTGFVVCAYLIQVCGLSVHDALKRFKAARPPGVKHEDFEQELYDRYSSWRPGAASPTGEVVERKSQLSSASDFRSVAAHLRRESQGQSQSFSSGEAVDPDKPGGSCIKVQGQAARGKAGRGLRRENDSLNLDEQLIYLALKRPSKSVDELDTILSSPCTPQGSLDAEDHKLASTLSACLSLSARSTCSSSANADDALLREDSLVLQTFPDGLATQNATYPLVKTRADEVCS
eukprot:jgi/Botrbrau1/21929/Bobra.0249s0053.2